MSYPFYLDWPDPEDVIFRKITSSPGGSTSSQITVCAQEGIPSRTERSSTGGVYQGRASSFLLPVALMQGQEPYPGDLIVKGGTGYAILQADHLPIFEWYACECVALSIYAQLQDTITIERPEYTQDEYSLDNPTFTAVYEDIPCRVQPTAAPDREENEVIGEVTFYDITIDRQLALSTNDRISWDGVYLTFLDYVNSSQIGELPVIKARSTN